MSIGYIQKFKDWLSKGRLADLQIELARNKAYLKAATSAGYINPTTSGRVAELEAQIEELIKEQIGSPKVESPTTSKYVETPIGEWRTDSGAVSDDGRLNCKPIRISRAPLSGVVHVNAGDSMSARITMNLDGCTSFEQTPTFNATRSMAINQVVKFEVIDELGFDIGIGFVFGQSKKGERK